MHIPVRRSLRSDGTAVVEVRGEVDFTNADEVSQAIQAAVREWHPRRVRVDLDHATFIDSTGLGALISGYRTAVEEHVGYVIVNPSDAFRRVLSVTGLCELFGLTAQKPAGGAHSSDIAI